MFNKNTVRLFFGFPHRPLLLSSHHFSRRSFTCKFLVILLCISLLVCNKIFHPILVFFNVNICEIELQRATFFVDICRIEFKDRSTWKPLKSEIASYTIIAARRIVVTCEKIIGKPMNGFFFFSQEKLFNCSVALLETSRDGPFSAVYRSFNSSIFVYPLTI